MSNNKNKFLYLTLKRILDICLSIIGILISLPIFFILKIYYKFILKETFIYKSKRVGQNLNTILVYKIRTLKSDSEKISKVTLLNDKRLLKCARFLRKYKIDEIPQFFNIIKGDMSIVGPRPNFKELVDYYPDNIKEVLKEIKPGLTDLAILKYYDMDKFVGDSSYKEYFKNIEPKKLDLILKYYRKRSFLLDLKIIIKTLLIIFFKK